MTLSQAKSEYDVSEINMRILINSELTKGLDFRMEIDGENRILRFTNYGARKLPFLVKKFRKDKTPC